MKCILYDMLIMNCLGDKKWIKFLESHRKNIRFTSWDWQQIKFTIANVPMRLNDLSVKRICNIQITGAA